jgi:hypothetical protein
MNEATDKALDLIYGRWRSQILYAGTELGIFDHVVRETAKPSEAVAAELCVDPALLYRLMRALASIGLLVENESRGFSTSEVGARTPALTICTFQLYPDGVRLLKADPASLGAARFSPYQVSGLLS